MCGGIKDNQFIQTVNIRLAGTANNANIILQKQLQNVEEIWIDEYFISAAAVGVHRLDIKQSGVRIFPEQNSGNVGIPIVVDNAVASHAIYPNPRIYSKQEGTTLIRFNISLINSLTNQPTAFQEFLLVLTFVMHKPSMTNKDLRMVAAVEEQVAMKGVDPRTTYQGGDFMRQTPVQNLTIIK